MAETNVAHELAALYARDLRRLEQEIDAFPDEAALWRTVPGVTNPAGNLVLHLEGNLREYIGRRLGAIAYTRQRPLEFSTKDVPKADLAARVAAVRLIIPEVIATLTEAQLSADPGADANGTQTHRQFLFALYGHFNFHLGQIGYLRRMLTAGEAVKFVTLEPEA